MTVSGPPEAGREDDDRCTELEADAIIDKVPQARRSMTVPGSSAVEHAAVNRQV